MAPELQAAAERIFLEGYAAGVKCDQARGLGAIANREHALAEWRRNQPGYRPIAKSPALAAPYSPSSETSTAPSADPYVSFGSTLFDTSSYDVVSSPAPDTSGWSDGGFSGGGGGDSGGGGASGSWGE